MGVGQANIWRPAPPPLHLPSCTTQPCQFKKHKLASNRQMSPSPMNPVEKSFLRTSLSNTWERRYSNERKFKEIWLQQRPFMFGTCRGKKSRQSGADLWKKCAPVSQRWAPADSSSAHQKTERNNAHLQRLRSEPKPAAWAWAIDHVEKTGQRQADRQGEERTVVEENPDSLILGLFLVLPDFLSPSVSLGHTCRSLARPLALVQLQLLPPHNNRNLQK